MDVQDDLALDSQVEVEQEAVDDVPDRPLDGVLQRDETQVHPTVTDGVEHLDQRAERGDVSGGVVRFAEEGLLGEGPLGSEEADAERGGA